MAAILYRRVPWMLAGFQPALALHSLALTNQVMSATLQCFAATDLTGLFQVLALTDQRLPLMFQGFTAAGFLSRISVESL
jgi:hypothetical protein